MSIRRTVSAVLLLNLVGGLTVVAPPASAQEKRDPKAVEIANAMMEEMGGKKAWDNAHYIRYDFVVKRGNETAVSRLHLWDKWSGAYRLEQPTEGDATRVVLFNANTKEGEAFRNGRKLEGEAAAKAVKDAHGAFINDMYWLAMPWKWLEPGVNLKYAGERTYKGARYDIVQLSFGKVGLTPGDRYDAFIAKDSRRMTHWEYTLESGRKGSWDWEYTLTGGILLAKTHTNAEEMEISMGDVRVFRDVDRAYFEDPSKHLKSLK